jgi:hypothetical protein
VGVGPVGVGWVGVGWGVGWGGARRCEPAARPPLVAGCGGRRRAAAGSGKGVSAPANRSAAAKSSRSTGCSPAGGGGGRVRYEGFGMVAWAGASLSEKDCAGAAPHRLCRDKCVRGGERKGRGWGHAC